MVMRLAAAPLQNGHVSVAHVAQTTKWLHGRKRTARERDEAQRGRKRMGEGGASGVVGTLAARKLGN